jgi:hypothetical protein
MFIYFSYLNDLILKKISAKPKTVHCLRKEKKDERSIWEINSGSSSRVEKSLEK